MGKLALYRKYRSRGFDELVGQDHVSSTLDNALKKGNISHAYLFTGPRGIGKTSAARIFAARVNELAENESSVDIIEIDAASNNGVDEIRELREKVHIAPNYHRYKVYIVDEVHMLSQAAFNALLKTLEEPPEHVIFILATTEPHKLPATIVSRTQHFAFRPVPTKAVAAHLKTIAGKESIKIDDEAATSIADMSGGSMRDAISLLDQISNHSQKIDKQVVYEVLGIADNAQVDNLIQAMETGDRSEVLATYDRLIDSGIAPGQLLDQLIGNLRGKLRSNNSTDIGLLQGLCTIHGNSPYLEATIEAVLLKNTKGLASETKHEPTPTKVIKKPKVAKTVKTKKASSKNDQPKQSEATTNQSAALDQATWVKTLSFIKSQDNALYALLRSTEQEFDGDKLSIKCRFQFHYRRLEESRNKQALAKALQQTLGRPIEIELSAIETKPPRPADADTNNQEDSTADNPERASIDNVLSIFGGEVL